ncbi:putative DNA-binding protein [Paenibacillus senegalensis]|uniref:putative DNA-binding protein n=1 Tax=Paenibacillus senegalensis TaxID=1465766 RepID=UPI000288A047|nr:putative DNA-binding protein [Paenibacillus senegalensis]
MPDMNPLDKTNRMNLLFDFYAGLLTEKQRTFLACYFRDDYSLGEIAAEYSISRQAVYEHIKRAEQMLEDYESKLHLLHKHEQRGRYLEQLAKAIEEADPLMRKRVEPLLQQLYTID